MSRVDGLGSASRGSLGKRQVCDLRRTLAKDDSTRHGHGGDAEYQSMKRTALQRKNGQPLRYGEQA
jgi:hypothetical protein